MTFEDRPATGTRTDAAVDLGNRNVEFHKDIAQPFHENENNFGIASEAGH